MAHGSKQTVFSGTRSMRSMMLFAMNGGGGFCVTSVVLALLAVLRLVMAFVMG